MGIVCAGRLSIALVMSATSAAVLLATPHAHAQAPAPGKEVAKKLFEDGVELEKKGEYLAALDKYKQAEQITSTAGLRFHKAYCYELLGKLNAALEEYDGADKLARETNKPEVHAAIAARVEPLRARIPQMVIRLVTVGKDAEVQLDTNPLGAGLLDGKSFKLDPGDHAVTARAPGYKNFVRHVQVPEGGITTVEVTLEPLPTSDGIIIEKRPEGSAPRSLVAPIATTAGAVGLVAFGIVFFAVAGSAQTTGTSECPTKVTCDADRTRVRAFDALSLGSFIGGAALGVIAVVLWTSGGNSQSAGRPGATTPSFVLGAHGTATGGSLGLEGAF